MASIIKKIEKAICDCVLTREKDAANGSSYSNRFNQPWDRLFAEENVVLLKDYAIACDGKVIWRVDKHYSPKKRNGCYQPLRPTLQRMDMTPSGIEALLKERGVPQRSIDRALGRPVARKAR